MRENVDPTGSGRASNPVGPVDQRSPNFWNMVAS